MNDILTWPTLDWRSDLDSRDRERYRDYTRELAGKHAKSSNPCCILGACHGTCANNALMKLDSQKKKLEGSRHVMLDLFTIFSKGGIVLWCFQGTCQSFTLPVNELIRSVILQVSFEREYGSLQFISSTSGNCHCYSDWYCLSLFIFYHSKRSYQLLFWFYTGAWRKQFLHSWLAYFEI